jgi:hypothetical protein
MLMYRNVDLNATSLKENDCTIGKITDSGVDSDVYIARHLARNPFIT